MSPDVAIFSIVFALAVALFACSCFRRFRLVTLGRAEDRFSNPIRRLGNMLLFPLTQRCALNRRYPFGWNHALLFWSFMVLLVANAEFLFHGIFPDYISLARLPSGAYYTLAFIFDVVSVLVLITVGLAVIRRLAFPPAHMEAKSRDAFIILGMVAALMIAFFGLHGSEIAHGVEQAANYMPVSSMVAAVFFSGASPGGLEIAAGVFWWLHAVILLFFLNYLPYSKHMHVLTAVPNWFFKSLVKVNTQPREEFQKGNTYGAGRIDRFHWKDLFDAYSCTECSRCSDVCPATATNKPLDPRLVVHNIKVNLLTNGAQLYKKGAVSLPLIGGNGEGSIAEEVLWECTTCGACVDVCPVAIEHFPKIVNMRRHLVEMEAKFPEELLLFFENIEQRSNPWGIAPADRVKWAAELDVKPFEAGKTEYLFYVGCFGAFDARSRKVTLAITRILDASGISWGILGKDELCCGDSLRRLGNEFVFDSMAKANVKMFQEKGVKKVITQCPHCYTTLKNDYRQYGADFEVVHHTELIDNLLTEGRLKLSGDGNLGKVIFHDSCYLGRYNDIYEAPRNAVMAAAGRIPLEMERNHSNSFCCGAGGGRMWLEESIGERINLNRVEEALAKDPQTICVSCPYCMTMFEDGLKDKDATERVQVLDVAEIVARTIKP